MMGGGGLKGLTVRILSLSDAFPETMNSFHLFLINFCARFKTRFLENIWEKYHIENNVLLKTNRSNIRHKKLEHTIVA